MGASQWEWAAVAVVAEVAVVNPLYMKLNKKIGRRTIRLPIFTYDDFLARR
jgi:hypothetical protein